MRYTPSPVAPAYAFGAVGFRYPEQLAAYVPSPQARPVESSPTIWTDEQLVPE